MFPELRAAVLRSNPWIGDWSETFVERTGFQGPGAKGWARRGRLFVAPSACTLPGRGYSWPGSVSDCTVRGVYLHEVGHVAHAALGPREQEVLSGLWELGGPNVTGYEPNPMERFAETFRLLAGNPGLLLAGRPRRFDFMVRSGVMWAGELKPWDEALRAAPQRFLDQCERWIKRGAAPCAAEQLELL